MKIGDISQLLDEKLESIKEEIEALGGRLDSVEKSQVSLYRVVQMRESLKSIEKKVNILNGKVSKSATKEDLKKMEKKLIKRFDSMDKYLDKDLANTMQKVKHIEDHIDIPPYTPVIAN